MADLRRQIDKAEPVIASGAAVSGVIDFRMWAGGVLKLNEAAWTAADIVFDVADSPTGIFTTLTDEIGTVVRLSSLPTAAAFARKLPDELFGAHYVKLRSVTAGTTTSANQAADRRFKLMLKG